MIAALLLVLLPAAVRRWLSWPLALAAAAGMLWTWAGHRELPEILLTGGVLAAAMGGAGAWTARRASRGTWPTLAAVAAVASILSALTGSVRLAQETFLIGAPMLALTGRPASDGAGRAAGMMLAGAVGAAVIFSSMGWAALIPALCLLCLPLGRRAAWAAPVAALGVGALLSAPVVSDWLRDPPF